MIPYFEDDWTAVFHGDCREVLPEIGPFETCITDPPYGLEFMGKDWDQGVPGTHFWELIRASLLPGSMCLAFGGTRTHHRLMCAIEDAGLELRDCLMWLYGSGFPKSLDIGKALDKEAGAEREVVGQKVYAGPAGNDANFGVGNLTISEGKRDLTAPATDAAKLWHGWGTALKPAYEIVVGAQKPYDWRGVIGITAHNIMEALCRLPSYAKDVGLLSELSRSGSGEAECDSALWTAVEKCNIPGDLCALMGTLPSGSEIPLSLNIVSSWLNTLGDLLKHGSTFTTETATDLTTDLKTLNCSPSPITPAAIIGDVISLHGTGSSASLAGNTFNVAAARLRLTLAHSVHGRATEREPTSHLDAIGSLSPAWEPIVISMNPVAGTFAENALEHGVSGLNIDGCRIGTEEIRSSGEGFLTMNARNFAHGTRPNDYHKRAEPSTHSGRWPANVVLDGESAVMLDEMSGESVSAVRVAEDVDAPKATYALGRSGVTPRGHTDSGGASRFFYTSKASRADRGEDNTHPTVKPTDLMEWLCKLTMTPTGGTVLDPFMGSGSTLVAARNVGRKAVGIELDESSCEIAANRLAQGVLSLEEP